MFNTLFTARCMLRTNKRPGGARGEYQEHQFVCVASQVVHDGSLRFVGSILGQRLCLLRIDLTK